MNIFSRKSSDTAKAGSPKSSGLFIAAFALISKWTVLIKFTKPLITIISMLASMIAYGLYLGPWFGVGLVVMLFIHEMGHIIAMRLRGIDTPAGPIFIPFIGALIFMKPTDNRDTEAFVGYGGPLLGTIAAIAALGLALFTQSQVLLLISYIGVILNLFNMIPISPLDGGRITQVVSHKMKYLGLVGIVGYTVYTGEPQLMLFIILILDGFRLPIGVRTNIGSAVLAAMFVLFILGYSSQPWYANVLDVFLGTFFCVMFWDQDRDRKKKIAQVNDMNRSRRILGMTELEPEPEAHPDDRAYPAMSLRVRWFVLYCGLCLTLTGLLYYEHTILPEAAKQHQSE